MYTYSDDFINTIYDNSGDNDSLVIKGTASASENRTKVYINVKSDQSYDKDLIIFREPDNGNDYTYQLTIEKYMEEGKIETIKTETYNNYSTNYKDKYYKFKDNINWDLIIENVAGWLSENNEFSDVQDVLDKGTSTQIGQVLAYFDGVWETVLAS